MSIAIAIDVDVCLPLQPMVGARPYQYHWQACLTSSARRSSVHVSVSTIRVAIRRCMLLHAWTNHRFDRVGDEDHQQRLRTCLRIVCNDIRTYRSCCTVHVVLVRRSFCGARIGRFANILQKVRINVKHVPKPCELISNLFTQYSYSRPCWETDFVWFKGGSIFIWAFVCRGKPGFMSEYRIAINNSKQIKQYNTQIKQYNTQNQD